MNRTLIRWLLRAYPSAWRQRYGKEFEELLQADRGGPRTVLDIVRAAFRERCSASPAADLPMNTYLGSVLSLSKQPSAFLPMAMSIAALAVVLVSVARFGVPPLHADEGATAHTWQLLMALQVPGMAWFAFKWIRRTPRLALGVLAIQVVLILAAMAPVYLLGL